MAAKKSNTVLLALLLTMPTILLAQYPPTQGLNTAWLGTEELSEKTMSFALSRIDDNVISALKHAWMLAEQGRSGKEAGVLLTETPDGEYSAQVVFEGNELFQVRFTVGKYAVAMFHTHPNSKGREPSPQDRKNADILGLPTFTMTDRGLWVYNPKNRQTRLVLPLLSWLAARNWTEDAVRRAGF